MEINKRFNRPGELPVIRVYRDPQYHRPVRKENVSFSLLKELIDTYGENASIGLILSLNYKPLIKD